MEVLVLCGIYMLEYMCFGMGLKFLFDMKMPLSKWSGMGIILTIGVTVLPVSAVGKNVITTIVVMLMVFLNLEGKTPEKLAKVALLLVFVSCMEDLFLYWGGSGLVVKEMSGALNNLVYLGTKGCAFGVIYGLCLLKNILFVKKVVRTSVYAYFILGVAVAVMMFCAATLDYTEEYANNDNYIAFCDILGIVIRLCVFLLVMIVTYIQKSTGRIEQLLKIEKMLNESQSNYYRQLLKIEEDTKKYRHDMNNHLIYVGELLRENNTDKAKAYLEELQGRFVRIQKKQYVTGNEMVDIILNYFCGMLPGTVQIEISGKVPVAFDMEDTDTCTIFSNLFQNIMEELQGENLENAKVKIEIEKGQEYVKYQIANTVHQQKMPEQNNAYGLPVSRKTDKRNHGMGLSNVKTTVERNGGRFFLEKHQNMFCVNLILPLKK